MISKLQKIKNNFFKFSLLVFIFPLIFSCKDSKTERVLPILGNFDVEYKQVNGKEIADTIYPKIPQFTYLSDDSVWVSNKDFKGKVWVVEFFFATCPTICPIMNGQMKKFVAATSDISKHIQVLSFTINPKNDLPHVLKAYRKKYGISAKNWTFLTGKSEDETNALGIENFLIFAGKDEDALGGYAHSGAFTLVDKEGYVRGVYQITNYDGTTNPSEYKRLNTEIRKLLKYEYKHAISE
jgi:protein SCO1/2